MIIFVFILVSPIKINVAGCCLQQPSSNFFFTAGRRTQSVDCKLFLSGHCKITLPPFTDTTWQVLSFAGDSAVTNSVNKSNKPKIFLLFIEWFSFLLAHQDKPYLSPPL